MRGFQLFHRFQWVPKASFRLGSNGTWYLVRTMPMEHLVLLEPLEPL